MTKLGIALAVLLLNTVIRAEEAANMLTEQTFESEVKLKVGYPYLLALPEGYQKEGDKKWPLLVFLHGAGERGNNLEKLKKHGPPKLIAAGKKFEAIVACPQVLPLNVWNPYGVKALVDELKTKYRVDESRIYLTGISMGGFGTWDTVMEFPDLFAAAVPICGGAGVKFVMAERIKRLPIWIFHGDADPAVPVDYSKSIQKALEKVSGHSRLTIYPGVAHDSWTQTYDNPEVWQWLFQQQKPVK
ncbi:hypothetical protein BH11VER1_BH11VER1_42030 [soil metagenome]